MFRKIENYDEHKIYIVGISLTILIFPDFHPDGLEYRVLKSTYNPVRPSKFMETHSASSFMLNKQFSVPGIVSSFLAQFVVQLTTSVAQGGTVTGGPRVFY